MTSAPATAAAPPALASAISGAIERRYADSWAARYGIALGEFLQIVTAVVMRDAPNAPETLQFELIARLHVEDLVLARACTAGNEAAWEAFLLRFRASLYECAYRIAKDEATGRELADELYADLYGVDDRQGRRASRLDYYTGRGSLEGWLRTVLAQRFVDRCRSRSKTVSLEEQLESGAAFTAPPEPDTAGPDPRLAAALACSLDELGAEERFLLASYYLDQRTLAQLARQLGVHESTMSRRLDRITAHLRKRVLHRLRAAGLRSRQAEELIAALDVRDLDLRVAAKLRQETAPPAFYKKEGKSAT